MIESDIASIMAPKTGVLYVPITRMLNTGKQTLESKKAEEERAMQETKRVQQVPQIHSAKGKIIDTKYWEGLPLSYNSQGKIIDSRYEKSGRYVDIK